MPSSALRVVGAPLGGFALAILAFVALLRRGLSRSLGPSLLQGWQRLPSETRSYIATTFLVSAPVGIVGTIISLIYQFGHMGMERIRFHLSRNCQVTIVFTNQDKHYDSIVDYIGSKCHVETGKVLATTTPRTRPSFQERLAYWLGGKVKAPTLYYQPDLQAFSDFFYWKDDEGVVHKIWISRHVEKPQIRSSENKQNDPETLSLTIWWTTNSAPLKEFLQTALNTMIKDDGGTSVDIYVKHMWLPMWTRAISREKRDRDTVILDEGQADFVVDDMKHFFSPKTADWYHNAGIPYRRGYLLYGPPGCGKTSFAQVLAGELNLDVCLMNLSNSDMNDDDLAELLRAAPAKSMLLLEDVDAIFVERAASAEKKGRGGGISFSGLLNALDGAAAQEGCVIMMTTNHKERLDEALVRPGRCDVHVQVEKASKSQCKRMFWRFFSKEPVVKSCLGGTIKTVAPHRLRSGDSVSYKVVSGGETPLVAAGRQLENNSVFYVHDVDATTLKLYSSQSAALNCGPGALEVTGGKGCKLQELSEVGVRFSNRIPAKQVSMAKLQGYLMKQKLLSERDVKMKRENDELASQAKGLGMAEEVLFQEEVHRLAAESAVVNVHELLDVKQEIEEIEVDIYDHFRRLGLHKFASIFEHYGCRRKKDITEDLKKRCEAWEPDLKVESPQRQRLMMLLGNQESLDKDYKSADLSVLRDQFLSTYQKSASEPDDGSRADGGLPAALTLNRSVSEPMPKTGAPNRRVVLRTTSGLREDKSLELLEMAHLFQERLETNGKTDVTMWQLAMHFERFAGDPEGALENCQLLRRPSASRSPSERQVQWTTTFGFLRRLGLEKYAYTLEDNGYKLWTEMKELGKDELKDKGEMSKTDAAICHAVLTNSSERPDLLRRFQIPEFGDIMAFFSEQYPGESKSMCRRFAVKLTDELGVSPFSCHQVRSYLKEVLVCTLVIKDASDTGDETKEPAEASDAAAIKDGSDTGSKTAESAEGSHTATIKEGSDTGVVRVETKIQQKEENFSFGAAATTADLVATLKGFTKRSEVSITLDGSELEMFDVLKDRIGSNLIARISRSASQAYEQLDEGLPSLEKAQAARKRPEPPPPRKEPTDWVYTWLKANNLQAYADVLKGQALETLEDILRAPIDHSALEAMGIKKIGDRCKILKIIEEERSSKKDPEGDDSKKDLEEDVTKKDAEGDDSEKEGANSKERGSNEVKQSSMDAAGSADIDLPEESKEQKKKREESKEQKDQEKEQSKERNGKVENGRTEKQNAKEKKQQVPKAKS